MAQARAPRRSARPAPAGHPCQCLRWPAMVQGAAKLNANKQTKGGRKHQAPKVSKVDILAKKKKKDAKGELAKSGATTSARKITLRTEANLAARVQVEAGGNLGLVKANAQTLAKVKGTSRVGLSDVKKD
uniref:Uncharacterized protein n=1 Tax=Zooxanthella nutricula TaxID=1333877 RepID=A0A7S2NEG7_9DINO